MKRILALCLLMMLLCLPALAEDITAQTSFSTAKSKSIPKITDRDYLSTWNGKDALSIAAPEGVQGLYLQWAERPASYSVEAEQNGRWISLYESEGEGFAHEYVPLEGAHTKLRLKPSKSCKLSEIYVFGAGEIPAFVQRWEPTLDACDLMLLIAHPDDEVVMFGGTLPYYAGELKKKVTVATFTIASARRRSELLDSLWVCGLKNYPILGDFADIYFKSSAAAYERWGTRTVREFTVRLFRRYKPLVVLTHDAQGEYGHGAHMLAASVAKAAFDMAAESDKYVNIYEQHGLWQVQKLYFHLGKTDAIEMDYDQPLQAFDGKTAFEVAKEAYQKHKSQHQYTFQVYERGSRYSSYRYSLIKTVVGPDVYGNDFLENTPVAIR